MLFLASLIQTARRTKPKQYMKPNMILGRQIYF